MRAVCGAELPSATLNSLLSLFHRGKNERETVEKKWNRAGEEKRSECDPSLESHKTLLHVKKKVEKGSRLRARALGSI